MDMYEVFAQNPLLAILRNVPKEITLDYAGAIRKGGVKVFEVALNSPDALEQIAMLRKAYGGECLIGAGTAITVERCQAALDAGAQFLLTPGTPVDVLAFCRDHNVMLLPGVMTPTDVAVSLQYGFKTMKLFPAGDLPHSYVKDLKGPYDDTNYIAMGLGLAGAALATAISPILSITICSFHFRKKTNTIRFVWRLPSAKLLAQSCPLGVSGFVGEMSSGVTTTVFNLLLLRLAGNVAVAAYGVVANYALVATAIFNGVSQGAQPLVSQCYGRRERTGAKKLLLLGSGTAAALAAAVYAAVYGFTDSFVALFNSEHSALMAQYAFEGMRIYFVGYLFAGFNIVASGYLSAVVRPVEATITSLSRGVVAIVACSLVLSALLGMQGVWMAFPVSEGITAGITLYLLRRRTGEAHDLK